MLGPVKVGISKFVFQVSKFNIYPLLLLFYSNIQANPPDYSKIPKNDLLGVSVIILKCFYKNKQFVNIGYYVNNEITGEENINKKIKFNDNNIDLIERTIIDTPRLTYYVIDWDNEENNIGYPNDINNNNINNNNDYISESDEEEEDESSEESSEEEDSDSISMTIESFSDEEEEEEDDNNDNDNSNSEYIMNDEEENKLISVDI